MRRYLLAGLALLLGPCAVLTLAVLDDRLPLQTRAVPVNSSTAVYITTSNTVASEAAGASTSDANTFTLGTAGAAAYSTNDALNGLVVKFTGSGSCAAASGEVRLIKDYVGSTDVVTLAAATSGVVDPNCTYVIGPALPPNMRNVCMGGCAGTCKVAIDPAGGTANTTSAGFVSLTGGQWWCIDQPKIQKIEVLSGSATDTFYVGWN